MSPRVRAHTVGEATSRISFQSPVSAAAILNKQSSNVSQVCAAQCETRTPARALNSAGDAGGGAMFQWNSTRIAACFIVSAAMATTAAAQPQKQGGGAPPGRGGPAASAPQAAPAPRPAPPRAAPQQSARPSGGPGASATARHEQQQPQMTGRGGRDGARVAQPTPRENVTQQGGPGGASGAA